MAVQRVRTALLVILLIGPIAAAAVWLLTADNSPQPPLVMPLREVGELPRSRAAGEVPPGGGTATGQGWVESWEGGGDPDIGRPAPDFALPTPEGELVRLSDFRGEKAVVINFWATWCPPCREEMPDLQRLYERRSDEMTIVAVNLRESAEEVQSFREEMGLTFPLVLDQDGKVFQRYLIRPMPTTFFVDRNGIVRHRHYGLMSAELMESLLESTLQVAGS